MLNLINSLCKNINLNNKQDFETFLAATKSSPNLTETIKSLISYKHPQTGDTVLNYAARFGNVNLINQIYENYVQFDPNQFLNSCNNDGKNGLHEACQNTNFECAVYLIEKGICINKLRKGDW